MVSNRTRRLLLERLFQKVVENDGVGVEVRFEDKPVGDEGTEV